MEVLAIAKQNEVQINEQITYPNVMVIGPNGEKMGNKNISDALTLSKAAGLDLVLLNNDPKNPVCKIIDYNKFRYEKQKREKEAKKKQQVIEVKEIQLSCKIGDHDLQTKLNHAHRFLNAGNKVKAVVRFSWRELRHPELGQAVLDKFEAGCEGVGAADKKAVLEGRNLTLFLSPVKK